jgi:hypothetical protein
MAAVAAGRRGTFPDAATRFDPASPEPPCSLLASHVQDLSRIDTG